MTDTSCWVGVREEKSLLIAQVAVEVCLEQAMGCLSQSRREAHNWVAEAEQVDGSPRRGEGSRPLCDLESPQLQTVKHMVDHHKRELNLDQDYTEGVVISIIDLSLIYEFVCFLLANSYSLCTLCTHCWQHQYSFIHSFIHSFIGVRTSTLQLFVARTLQNHTKTPLLPVCRQMG